MARDVRMLLLDVFDVHVVARLACCRSSERWCTEAFEREDGEAENIVRQEE